MHSLSGNVPADNPASWQWMIEFYQFVTSVPIPHRQNCLPLLRLVQQLADSPYSQTYRAGQSVYSLIISTKAQHGLGVTDSHVYIEAQSATMLRVEYRQGLEVGDTVESHLVPECQALETLKPLLVRLKSDTEGHRE